jgi:hypothetical protein
LLILGNVLISEVEAKLHDVRIGGPAFWGKVEAALDRATDPAEAMPPEKKKRLLSQIRAVSAEWAPYVLEAYAGATAGRNPPVECK